MTADHVGVLTIEGEVTFAGPVGADLDAAKAEMDRIRHLHGDWDYEENCSCQLWVGGKMVAGYRACVYEDDPKDVDGLWVAVE